MAIVHHWTGLEARALRRALRMSVRAFAEHLGVGVRTVSKWEKLLTATEPRPDSQAILDTTLARSGTDAQERFVQLLVEQGVAARLSGRVVATPSDYETWTDDVERAVVCLNRQDFGFTSTLLERWLHRVPPRDLDRRGLYLYARSLTLYGDMRRFQGRVRDLVAARDLYRQAHSLYTELGIPRRAAQIELSLTIVSEMSGQLGSAARQYGALADDGRLSRCDQVRARLWIGTSLAKQGDNDAAIPLMRAAARHFDDLGEPGEWAVAQQKLALAHRGAGDLSRAVLHITTARSAGEPRSPLERVQLDTAYAHILVSDPATARDGHTYLDRATAVAGQYSLGHQLRSIETIRDSEEHR